ncbi:MAG: hypothetical protein ACNA7Y_02180, partial [Gammaproteobacteria bacterium]
MKEETPEKTTVKFNDAERPLTPQLKLTIVKEIQTQVIQNPAYLKKLLYEAVLKMYQFPEPLEQTLKLFKEAYKKIKEEAQETDSVSTLLEKTIEAYINEIGFSKFKMILEKQFDEVIFRCAGLLGFFANKLGISMKNDPLVEVVIQKAKIFWRVSLSYNSYYERHKKDSDFWSTPLSMTWETFSMFKNSGKRSGSVEVTRERFIEHFKEDLKTKKDKLALGAIWDELKEKGVLNHRNRLSDEWREAISKKVILKTLDYLINKDKYQIIADALFSIVNDDQYKEVLTEISIPEAIIFRQDRTKKTWNSKGGIVGFAPKSKEYCTKLWDVGIKKYLTSHRNTVDEENANKGKKLNYDHIPSSSAIKSKVNVLKEKINKKNIYVHNDGDDDNKTISDGEHSCISNYTT